MWKAVETSAREVGMGKAEGRRSKGRSREKKKEKTVEVRKIAEEWEIWDEEEEAVKLEVEARKLVPEKFHR